MKRSFATVLVLATSLSLLGLASTAVGWDSAAEGETSPVVEAPNAAPQDFEAFNRGQAVARYQMVQGSDGDMFMLDTATADVYRRTLGEGWYFEGNPVHMRLKKEQERAAAEREQAEADRTIEDLNITVNLPREVVHLTLDQRRTAALPGSDNKIFVHLGDITGGRVRLSIYAAHGSMLLDHITMRPGAIASFNVGEQPLHLKLVELKNALLGTDFAEIEISKDRSLLEGDENADADHSDGDQSDLNRAKGERRR